MITIAWDVDDVLNNLTEAWLKDYNERCGFGYKYEDLTQNPPCKLLKLSHSEYIDLLDSFRLSEKAKNLDANLKILKWMKQYSGKFSHIALTATSAHTAHNSAFWVLKNYGQYIHSYNIIPAKRNYTIATRYKTKKDFLLAHEDVKILVDDNIQNIEEANSCGVKAYLLKQPWNNGLDILQILDEIDREAME